MIPLIMRLRIQGSGKGFRLLFPVVLLWILVLALMIVLLPFLLIGVLFTWRRGPGPALLAIYPLLFSVLFSLSGLHFEFENAKNRIFMSFT
jgi:prepilin signal peptidase PulO-like enzyme (type II secretory pathway)